MIACLTLAQFANLATILGAAVAVGALLYTAWQVSRNTLTSRASFCLELEKMFQAHDPVHLNLRPGGRWSDGVSGPRSPQDWAALEDYMGLFEHCEIMMNSGLIDVQTFSNIFVYRLRNIVANCTIVDAKLWREEKSWGNFLALLRRFDIRLPKQTKQQEEHTMIPEKLQEIMKKDGVVAIATLGPDGPHMVNTWNSYLRISQDGRLFIPAGYMHKTEANITHNPDVLITLGSSKVEGLHGAGAGFLIKGKARFVTSGPDFDFMKEKFSWLRATLAVTIESATQTW